MKSLILPSEKILDRISGINLIINKRRIIHGTIYLTEIRTLFEEDSPDSKPLISVKDNYLIEIPHYCLYKISAIRGFSNQTVNIDQISHGTEIFIFRCNNARKLIFGFKNIESQRINNFLTHMISLSPAIMPCTKRSTKTFKIITGVRNMLAASRVSPKSSCESIDVEIIKSKAYNENPAFLFRDLKKGLFFMDELSLSQFLEIIWWKNLEHCKKSPLLFVKNGLLGFYASNQKNPSSSEALMEIVNPPGSKFSYIYSSQNSCLFTLHIRPCDPHQEKHQKSERWTMNVGDPLNLPSSFESKTTCVYNLDTRCSSLPKIIASFYLLCKLSSSAGSISERKIISVYKKNERMMQSISSLFISDHAQVRKDTSKDFHSSLHQSKWLDFVFVYLSTSNAIAHLLKEMHVVVKSIDFPLPLIISSLVKVMIDPYYRTIEGFWCIIFEEFISNKYSFRATEENFLRYGYAYEPSLLLLLNSVDFLLKRFPFDFEFDSSFLICLADVLPSGLFSAISVNDKYSNCCLNAFRLMKLWDRYKNPLYDLFINKRNKGHLEFVLHFCDLDIWEEFFLRWSFGSSELMSEKFFPKIVVKAILEIEDNAKIGDLTSLVDKYREEMYCLPSNFPFQDLLTACSLDKESDTVKSYINRCISFCYSSSSKKKELSEPALPIMSSHASIYSYTSSGDSPTCEVNSDINLTHSPETKEPFDSDNCSTDKTTSSKPERPLSPYIDEKDSSSNSLSQSSRQG